MFAGCCPEGVSSEGAKFAARNANVREVHVAVDVVINEVSANFFPHVIGERAQPTQFIAREQKFSVLTTEPLAVQNFPFNLLKLSSDKQNFFPPFG